MGSPAASFPTFDHYTVTRVLGEGGMGVVYEAQDRRTELPVAIKVMSRHRLSDPDLQKRFLKENEILASLNHRNIVRCYEITRSVEGNPSIVMEYLDGVDFRAFEGRPYTELLPLMIQALMGLNYLKQRNILHRDLSSNNILVVLERGKRLVKIVDFGVAKILHEARREGDVHTRTGQFLGKFSFASPEVFLSNAVDWRADVYSLGVIFHRLLTRRTPLRVERAANYYEWVMAHQRPLVLDLSAPMIAS
jgi:serine/threonine protein kinase